jgi:hypothetical protein
MRNKGSVVVVFYQVGKFHTYPFPFLTPPCPIYPLSEENPSSSTIGVFLRFLKPVNAFFID